MTFNYVGLEITSLSLITRFGKDATLNRVTEGAYDPSTGTNTGASTSTQTVKAVFTDYKEMQIDGSIVQRGDRLVLVAASGISEPLTNDEIDGYKVVNVKLVKPAETALLYKLQVRK